MQLVLEGHRRGWSDRTGRIYTMVVMVIRTDSAERTARIDKSERTDISDI